MFFLIFTFCAICSFSKKSNDSTVFTREVRTDDLIQMASEIPDDSIIYSKHEESVFIWGILERSRGMLRMRVDLGHKSEEEQDMPHDEDMDTVDHTIDLGKEFEANGTYLIEKAYCKLRTSRNAVFNDLKALYVKKGSLLAIIDACEQLSILLYFVPRLLLLGHMCILY